MKKTKFEKLINWIWGGEKNEMKLPNEEYKDIDRDREQLQENQS